MANGTKGRDKPLPLDSLPVGDRLPVPHTPSATFMAWCISNIFDATRGDAELEGDRERSEWPMGDALLDASDAHFDGESVLHNLDITAMSL